MRVASALLTVVTLCSSPIASSALAQALQNTATAPMPPDADSSGDVVIMDELVISGTIAPKRPMDSPASITTIVGGDIKAQAPVGAPELLKSIPGFYVESAGGETRANVRTRGLAGPGGYFYAGLQEDGMPVVGENRIRGTEPDMLTRLTTFVGRVEAIRGGASGIFQDSTPGGIINFINREGGRSHQGDIYLQTTDYGQIKAELWDSGPLNDDTFYAFYAGYRRDDGQKETGYLANHGGSIIGNVKHVFADDRGYIKFTGKWVDEANLFWLPIPLQNAADPRTIPGGPDILEGSLYSSALKRQFSIATPEGVLAPDVEAYAGNARTAYLTADLDLRLGEDWRIKNLSRFTYIDFRNDVPILSSIATPLQTLANSIAAGAGTQFASARNATTGNYGYRLYDGGRAVSDPTSLNTNGLGILQSLGQTMANIDNFQNDFRLIRQNFNGGAIALGLYASFLNTSSYAYGHTIVNSVSQNAQPLDFEYLDAATGQSLGFGTFNGVRQMSATASYRHATSAREQFSPYLSVEQTFGRWSLEAGIRHQDVTERVAAEMPALYNLNAGAGNIPALRNAAFGSGNWRHKTFNLSDTIWTAAVNYKFSDNLGSFVRYMSGYRMPLSGDMLNSIYNGSFNPGPTEEMQQVEAGVKYSTRKLSAFLTLINSTQDNQIFVGNFAQPDGTIAQTTYLRSAESKSLEAEVFYTPFEPLTLHLIGTVQDVGYANDVFVSGIDRSTGQTVLININGNRPVRVPKVYGTVNVAYRFPEVKVGQFTANLDWEYLGERPGDDANRTSLKAYDQVNFGVTLRSGRFSYRAQVKNLTNKVGLTEGDPRTAQLFGDPTAAYLNARTIFPRSFLFSVDFSY